MDILVNNAGTAVFGPTAETLEENWDTMFNTNLKGHFFLVGQLAPKMAARGKGAIVNTSTMVGQFAAPGMAVYGATKAGLNLLTKSWATATGWRYGGDPNEWVENNNWNPATIPSGTATFTATGVTSVANDNGVVTIGAIDFTVGAQAYTFSIDNAFIVNGAGVTNSSTNTQTFNVTGGNSLVQNASSANSGTGAVAYNNSASSTFQNNSSAGNANTSIINNEIMQFNDNSSAGRANITNNVEMDFFESTTAGSANITNATGRHSDVQQQHHGGTATIGNSGDLQFTNTTRAGSAGITNKAGAPLLLPIPVPAAAPISKTAAALLLSPIPAPVVAPVSPTTTAPRSPSTIPARLEVLSSATPAP